MLQGQIISTGKGEVHRVETAVYSQTAIEYCNSSGIYRSVSELITSKVNQFVVQCKEVPISTKNDVHVYIFIECTETASLQFVEPMLN